MEIQSIIILWTILCPQIWELMWNEPVHWNTETTKTHKSRDREFNKSISILEVESIIKIFQKKKKYCQA